VIGQVSGVSRRSEAELGRGVGGFFAPLRKDESAFRHPRHPWGLCLMRGGRED